MQGKNYLHSAYIIYTNKNFDALSRCYFRNTRLMAGTSTKAAVTKKARISDSEYLKTRDVKYLTSTRCPISLNL